MEQPGWKQPPSRLRWVGGKCGLLTGAGRWPWQSRCESVPDITWGHESHRAAMPRAGPHRKMGEGWPPSGDASVLTPSHGAPTALEGRSQAGPWQLWVSRPRPCAHRRKGRASLGLLYVDTDPRVRPAFLTSSPTSRHHHVRGPNLENMACCLGPMISKDQAHLQGSRVEFLHEKAVKR